MSLLRLPVLPRDVIRLIIEQTDMKTYGACCRLNKEYNEFCKSIERKKLAQFLRFTGTFRWGRDTYDALVERTRMFIGQKPKSNFLSQLTDCMFCGPIPDSGCVFTFLPDNSIHGLGMFFHSCFQSYDYFELTYDNDVLHGPYKFLKGGICIEDGLFEDGNVVEIRMHGRSQSLKPISTMHIHPSIDTINPGKLMEELHREIDNYNERDIK